MVTGKTRRDTYVGALVKRKRRHLHLNMADNGFDIGNIQPRAR